MNKRKIISSIAGMKVFRRLAKLTEEEKKEVIEKVKDKLEKQKEMLKNIKPKDDSNKETQKEQEASVQDEIIEDNTLKESEDKGKIEEIVNELAKEIKTIKEDGRITTGEVLGLITSMITMVNSLIDIKPKNTRRKRKASQEDRENKIAKSIVAARGQQVRRKDKDLMSDTGGISKGLKREPSKKPPRDDLRNRYRKKDKPSKEWDKDIDMDKDLKVSSRRARLGKNNKFLINSSIDRIAKNISFIKSLLSNIPKRLKELVGF